MLDEDAPAEVLHALDCGSYRGKRVSVLMIVSDSEVES